MTLLLLTTTIIIVVIIIVSRQKQAEAGINTIPNKNRHRTTKTRWHYHRRKSRATAERRPRIRKRWRPVTSGQVRRKDITLIYDDWNNWFSKIVGLMMQRNRLFIIFSNERRLIFWLTSMYNKTWRLQSTRLGLYFKPDYSFKLRSVWE